MPAPNTRWITRSWRSRAMRSRSLAICSARSCSVGLPHLDQVVDPDPSSGWKKGLRR